MWQIIAFFEFLLLGFFIFEYLHKRIWKNMFFCEKKYSDTITKIYKEREKTGIYWETADIIGEVKEKYNRILTEKEAQDIFDEILPNIKDSMLDAGWNVIDETLKSRRSDLFEKQEDCSIAGPK